MAWKRELTLAALNASSENTMVAHLGIVYIRLEEALLEAEMPVDARTHQPFGLLHGGASAALASAGSREAPARARISRFLMPDILKSPYEKVDGR